MAGPQSETITDPSKCGDHRATVKSSTAFSFYFDRNVHIRLTFQPFLRVVEWCSLPSNWYCQLWLRVGVLFVRFASRHCTFKVLLLRCVFDYTVLCIWFDLRPQFYSLSILAGCIVYFLV